METRASEIENRNGVRSNESFVFDEAVDKVKDSEPNDWLVPTPALVESAKQASEQLFSLTANQFGKGPLSKLYTHRFDAEQIWQQIDLQSHAVLGSVRVRLRKLDKVFQDGAASIIHSTELDSGGDKKDTARIDVAKDDGLSEDNGAGLEVEEGQEMSDSENEDEEKDEDGAARNGVEDKFLKLSEMERFLDEADQEDESGPVGDGEKEDEEDMAHHVANGDDFDELKYDDFFKNVKQKLKAHRQSLADVSGDELASHSMEEGGATMTPLDNNSSQVEKLSTHEKQVKKMRKRMEQLEKASLDPREWTQLGEVTARKRPKNSALEVELDFEHNVQPAPVITEEVTASLEEIIRGRIAEERFDDVERKSAQPVHETKKQIELDENKSKKGLAEIYEGEYMQKTGMVAAPASASDATKAEASSIFKSLCVRLDALSHYHFAPKPVVEDMEVRPNIPALSMEEVGPLAVSGAAMLAPEEVYAGKGVLKEEAEFTHEERRRRRASKKRKVKGKKRDSAATQKLSKKEKETVSDKLQSGWQPRNGQSSYGRSSKVFADLELKRGDTKRRKGANKSTVNPAALKL